MKATISLESLWATIQSLSKSNKEWLADKLINDLEENDYISKEEVLAGIDTGLKDLKNGRKQTFEDFIKEMEDAV